MSVSQPQTADWFKCGHSHQRLEHAQKLSAHTFFGLKKVTEVVDLQKLDKLTVKNLIEGAEIGVDRLFDSLRMCRSLRFLTLKNCRLDTKALPLLETFIIYNERVEVLDLSNNKLCGMQTFFKNLNRNWLTKLSQLNLSGN